MKNIFTRIKGRNRLYDLLLILLLTGLILFISLCAGRELESDTLVKGTGNTVEITGMDYAHAYANLDEGLWEYYQEELYEPEDFNGNTQIREPVVRHELEQRESIAFGTYRILLTAAPHTYYALSGYSPDYSGRYYVNGDLVLETGKVSTQKEFMVPRINYFTIPVYSGEGSIEIIVQTSNYVHSEGGGLGNLMIASPTVTEIQNTDSVVFVYLLCGGFLVLAVMFLMDFLMQKKYENLCMAVCCVNFACRNQKFYITMLLPWEYNWYIHYRMVILFILVEPVTIFFLCYCLYHHAMNKKVGIAYLCATIGCILLLFALPTQWSAQCMRLFYWFCLIPYGHLIAALVKYFRTSGRISREDVITGIGFLLFFTALILDLKFQGKIPIITRNGIAPIGMLLFILCMRLVLNIRQTKEEIVLHEVKEQNQKLEQISRMKAECLETLSHEMLTPLTVMSGYAQRAKHQLDQGSITEESRQGMLQITLEAQRLAMLVEQILDAPLEGETEEAFGAVSMQILEERICGICEPILMKNGNQIQFIRKDICPDIYGSTDLILQVILNLCVNANRHVADSTIKIEERAGKGKVWLIVSDRGTGISPELLPHVFERGISGDGKNGMGLFICQEVMESMGGKISIQSTPEEGTDVILQFDSFEGEDDQ